MLRPRIIAARAEKEMFGLLADARAWTPKDGTFIDVRLSLQPHGPVPYDLTFPFPLGFACLVGLPVWFGTVQALQAQARIPSAPHGTSASPSGIFPSKRSEHRTGSALAFPRVVTCRIWAGGIHFADCSMVPSERRWRF